MKNLLVDTNIVLDLLAKRDTFYQHAASLFSLAETGKINLFVNALTIANTHYVLSNHYSKHPTREVLKKLSLLVEIIALDQRIIECALNDSAFSDFEDGIQYYCAVERNLDNIITRNLRDFKASNIPVLTAEEYLIKFNSVI